MPCLINSGLSKDQCSYLIGGVNNIYIANKSDVINFTDTDLDGIFDSVVMNTTSGTGKFYKYETAKNTSSYSAVLTVNGGVKNILQTVDFFVPRADQIARDLADKLSLGTFVAIVQNRMGKYIVLGILNGLEATVGELNSGVAETDSASLHITLSGTELDYGHEFDGSIPL